MAEPNWKNRTIWTGDNLYVMRGMNDESVDLIYLDPPFNSNQDYAAPIGSAAAGASFKDTWTLSDVDEAWHGEVADRDPKLYAAIDAAGLTHGKGMKSYLIMMAVRLLEMQRLLKGTGSIYLHCDPTAGHYLKVLMDSIFGQDNFCSEIVWKRTSAHSATKGWGPVHDTILMYGGGGEFTWNRTFQPYDSKYIEKFYRHRDDKGLYRIGDLTASGPRNGQSGQPWRGIDPGNRHWAPSRSFPGGDELPTATHAALDALDQMGRIHWPQKGGKPGFKRYLHEMSGNVVQDIVTDIRPLSHADKERTSYPTQKPLALLDRIIRASSNECDVVFDPFCGCATALVAADRLERQWVGIDLSEMAAKLVLKRIREDRGPLFKDVIHRTDIPVQNDFWLQPHPTTNKHTLFGKQEGKCTGCLMQFPFRNFTIDHIVPQSKGGQDNYDNLQLLCGACNSAKGTGTQAELIAKLKAEGIRP